MKFLELAGEEAHLRSEPFRQDFLPPDIAADRQLVQNTSNLPVGDWGLNAYACINMCTVLLMLSWV